MTQELIQEMKQPAEKPAYSEWLASLKQRVETSAQEEQEEFRWRQRYGKT